MFNVDGGLGERTANQIPQKTTNEKCYSGSTAGITENLATSYRSGFRNVFACVSNGQSYTIYYL